MLTVGPHFERPLFPVLADSDQLDVPDTETVKRSFRKIYDWKAYTPHGLAIMEAYWDSFVASVLSRLLPAAMQQNRAAHHGINLGTFNGAYQKAWVRAGYPMYGIEIADVIDEIHEYGLEGERASFFDLSSLPEESFDFGVLDRAIATENWYRTYDRVHESDDNPITRSETVPSLFESIFRIIRPGGSLIGILYGWYSGPIIAELAQYGEMKIWPTYTGLLGFRVVKGPDPTALPSIFEESPTESAFFRRFYACPEGIAALFLPTNEVIIKGQTVQTSFAPVSEHWSVLSK